MAFVLLKSAMLLAATLIPSAGLARYWLLGRVPRVVTALGVVGVLALVTFSMLDLRATVMSVLPTADLSLVWRYFTTTAHGDAVQFRVGFALALGALLLMPQAGSERGTGVAFAAGSVGLLATFSVISHAAAMGGWWPLLSDLVHFIAAGLWAGAVFALVVAPVWEPEARPRLESAVRRLSTLGLLAVIALAVTGTLNALIHAGEPESFIASSYVTALAAKLALVVITVALAALNRFRLLPRLLAGANATSMRRALRIESVLLVAVLVATGWLSTTSVPHDMTRIEAGIDVIENAEGLIEYLWR